MNSSIKDRFLTCAQRAVLPNNILIILSNPRSGSTWLFDAIRCHPAVEMIPSGIIYERLALAGRRYPRDLSGRKKGSVRIEVRTDRQKKDWVPDFSVSSVDFWIPDEISKKPYAIEKIHPHFYDFDVDAMCSKISELEKQEISIKMLYLVRDPKASLESFLNYQRRNSTWNKNRKPSDLFLHLARTYRSILDFASSRDGLIIDYGNMQRDFLNTLSRIFTYLWPESEVIDKDRHSLIYHIKSITAWEKRKSKKPFLGEKMGQISGHQNENSDLFARYEDEIASCYQSYKSLLGYVRD